MQLDSLLRSIRDNFRVPFVRIVVLYRASTAEYANGYARLIDRHLIGALEWQSERCFRDDLLGILDSVEDASLLMFLVDDNVVFSPFADTRLLCMQRPQDLFISLRADTAYTETRPKFLEKLPYLKWRWRFLHGKTVTWNYPFSVDGNIFRAEVVKKIIRSITFKAPNSLEGEMHQYRKRFGFAWRYPYGLSLPHAVVFNNPLNKVQSEGETWNQGISVEELNAQYLAGQEIDNASLYTSSPNAVHFAAPIALVPVKCS